MIVTALIFFYGYEIGQNADTGSENSNKTFMHQSCIWNHFVHHLLAVTHQLYLDILIIIDGHNMKMRLQNVEIVVSRCTEAL